MGRPRKERAPQPPIWRLPDALWAEVEPILEELDPPKRKGPTPTPARPILDAVIYRGRTGCQWNRLPKEYPDDSTVHRRFQRWVERGVDWEWQAADAALGKAPKGGTRSARTRPTAASPA